MTNARLSVDIFTGATLLAFGCPCKDSKMKYPNLTYRIPKGNIPWNKGKGRVNINCDVCGKEISILLSQRKRRCSRVCGNIAKRKPDNELKYGAIHKRVREMYGTPNECEHCGTTESKKFEWANISGEYKLERTDWARLCCQCHRRYDFGIKNRIEVL